MEILINTFRLCIFIFMMIGYINLANKIVDTYFSPIFTLTSIALIMFVGGIIGQLLIIFYIFAVFGLIAGCYAVYDFKKNISYLKFTNFTNVLVFFGFLIFGLQLISTELVHYDNFSHWVLVVKEILINDAFPTTQNVLIEFTNYPLGTASFIYFVCKILGNEQSTMLIAQAMLIFSCFSAMYAIIRDKKRFLLTLVLTTGLCMLSFYNISIRINNLLVDFLLPMLSLAAIAIIYTHRENPNRIFITVTPVLGLLVITKNTGVIYAAIAVIYLIYVLIKHCKKSRLKTFGKFSIATALSFLPTFLWSLHVANVFAGVENKFEVDASTVSSSFGGKTIEEVKEICNLFIETFFDMSLRQNQGFWLFTSIAIIACFIAIFVLKKKWSLPKVLLLMIVTLIAYYGGLLAMYIYMMPLDEAIYLAGFDRYACSIIVLYGGVLTMCFTLDIQNSFFYKYGEVEDVKAFKSVNTKSLYNKAAVLCAMLIFMILSSEYNGISYNNALYEDSIPAKVKAIVGDNWETEVSSDSYLIYAPDVDAQVTNYFVHYVSQYYLRAENLDCICLFYEDNMINLLSQYDYLVIVEADEDERGLMEKYFGIAGDEGIYKTEDLLSKIN